jgi:hypothetical protein
MSMTDSLEASLLRVIENDPENYAAKTKLKLWRLCRVLTRDRIGDELVAMYIANRSVNTLHYSIFGHNGKNRATVMDLVDPQLSLMCKSMGEVYEALTTFGAGSRIGHLLIMLDADFTSAELRHCCRKQLLGVGIGLEDMFGAPMSGPPYSPAPLARAHSKATRHRSARLPTSSS